MGETVALVSSSSTKGDRPGRKLQRHMAAWWALVISSVCIPTLHRQGPPLRNSSVKVTGECCQGAAFLLSTRSHSTNHLFDNIWLHGRLL